MILLKEEGGGKEVGGEGGERKKERTEQKRAMGENKYIHTAQLYVYSTYIGLPS